MADEPNTEENPNTDGGGPAKRVHNQPYPPNNNRGGRGGGGGFRGRPQWNRGGQNQQNWNNRNNNNQNRNNSNDGNNQDQEMNDDDGDQGSSSNYPRVFDKDRVLKEKLSQIGGSTVNLPSRNEHEVKFSERNRLYIGNLSAEITEAEIKEMLEKYGEICDLQINKSKMFAFVKYDLHKNAQLAKNELEGLSLKNKNLKIRFAPSNATVKVKNLPDFVSNELLRYAFGVFGDVESAQVLVDEKGKPTGEGVVEFTKKGYAMAAVRKCQERCFFITSALQPCIVEYFQYVTDSDGCPEKCLPKKNHGYLRSRETGPRLAPLDSFEHEYGTRWKQMLELYEEKQRVLKQELEMEKEKLCAQAEFVRAEHETNQLRRQLARREMDRERQQREWEMKEQLVDALKKRNEEELKRRESAFFQFQPHSQQQRSSVGGRYGGTSSPPPSLNFAIAQNSAGSSYNQQQQQQQRPAPFARQNAASIDNRSGELGGRPPPPLFGGNASIGRSGGERGFSAQPGQAFVFNNTNNVNNARQSEEQQLPPPPVPLMANAGRWARQADDVPVQPAPLIPANKVLPQGQQQPENFRRLGNKDPGAAAADPDCQIVADKTVTLSRRRFESCGQNLLVQVPEVGKDTLNILEDIPNARSAAARFQPHDRRSAEELLQNQQFRRRGDLVEDRQRPPQAERDFATRAGFNYQQMEDQQRQQQLRDRPPRSSRFNEAAPPPDRDIAIDGPDKPNARRIAEEQDRIRNVVQKIDSELTNRAERAVDGPPAVLTFEPPAPQQDPGRRRSRSPPRQRGRGGDLPPPTKGREESPRFSGGRRDASQAEPPRAVLVFEPPDPQEQLRRRSRSPPRRLGRGAGDFSPPRDERELQFSRRRSRSPDPNTWHDVPREGGPRWSPVPAGNDLPLKIEEPSPRQGFQPPEHRERSPPEGSREAASWRRVGGAAQNEIVGRKSPEIHPEIIELDDDSEESGREEPALLEGGGGSVGGDPSEFVVAGGAGDLGGDRQQPQTGEGRGGRSGGRNRPRHRRNRMRNRNDSQKRGFNEDKGGPPPKRRFM